MAIPDYQTLMLPLLRYVGDGNEHHFRTAIDVLAGEFALSDIDRIEMLPSGTATVFGSRVGWAKSYMKQAGLVEYPKRGMLRITPAGKKLLARNPASINNAMLDEYESFRAFRERSRSKDTEDSMPSTAMTAKPDEQTPEDAMASAHASLRKTLEGELLEQIKTSSPAFFEQLVVDLVVAMGYGGSHQDAGRAIGRSGDGGIDGIINEDKLGLDVIYLQAKRWDNTVGRPVIQKFAGALQGEGASKGIFITTSTFTKEAIDFSKRNIAAKIILIDGEKLTALMFDHNVAVTRTGFYEIKKIDSDYFEGE